MYIYTHIMYIYTKMLQYNVPSWLYVCALTASNVLYQKPFRSSIQTNIISFLCVCVNWAVAVFKLYSITQSTTIVQALTLTVLVTTIDALQYFETG